MTTNSVPTPPKQGVRARERNALERISGLESDFARLVQGASGAINEVNSKIDTLSETLAAVVDILGRETVQKAILDARIRRMEENAQQSKDALAKAVEAKQVEAVEIIEDGDFIITGVEKDKEGKPLPPGYVQVPFSSIKPEFKEKLVGQVVGFSFETESGGSFEVTGVYKNVPPAEDTAPEETPDPVEDSPAVEQ